MRLLFFHHSPHPTKSNQRLPGGGPDVLDVTVTLSEAVDAVVRLSHGADETAKGVGLVLAGVASVLVNLCDGDLDGTVVLGSDDAVGGAALARDVTVVIDPSACCSKSLPFSALLCRGLVCSFSF